MLYRKGGEDSEYGVLQGPIRRLWPRLYGPGTEGSRKEDGKHMHAISARKTSGRKRSCAKIP